MASTNNSTVTNDSNEIKVLKLTDENGVIYITDEIDLGGNVCNLPYKSKLVFKGGIIKNGILTGNLTSIESTGVAFDRVTIKGSWDVPLISTKLFANLNYYNSLCDVIALANPNIKNKIIIEKGDYYLKAVNEAESCIELCDNTDLFLEGSIHLLPNSLEHYNILLASGNNISVDGNGTIAGDRPKHLGIKGEWGMGINIYKGHNVSINNITIRDCWGDCIYVGGKSTSVSISNCHINNGRRQGISVTDAVDVVIKDCIILNVSGTNPQYALDLEPNKNCKVDNVLIKNVKVKDCRGGISAFSNGQDGQFIGTVSIIGCSISVIDRRPIRLDYCKKGVVNNNLIYVRNNNSSIRANKVDSLIINDNIIVYDNNTRANLNTKKKKLYGSNSHIEIIEDSKSIISGNSIIVRN